MTCVRFSIIHYETKKQKMNEALELLKNVENILLWD
jgi:hypothetical protein